MKLLLTVISGGRELDSITISAHESVTFGRTHACDRAFETDLHMSSRHFQITHHGDYAEVGDLGSTNGTWLNGDKVHTERLREGSQIRAGTTVLTVEFVVEPEQAGGGNAPSFDAYGATVDPQQYSAATPQIPLREQQLRGNSAPPNPVHPPPAGISRASGNSLPGLDSAPAAPRSGQSAGGGGGPGSSAGRNLTPFGDSVEFDPQSQAGPSSSDGSRGGNLDSLGSFSGGAGTGRSQPASSSPFESQADEAAFGPPAAGAAKRDNRNTPFGESSVDLQVDKQALFGSKQPAASGFQLFQRQTIEEAADCFAIVLDSLARKWSIQLILHFHKVRNEPPPLRDSRVLFSWLPEEANPYSPICVSWSEVCRSPLVMTMLPRLCRADGCVALLGKSTAEITLQIEQMQSTPVEGFAEAGGFLPIYWPSSLTTMLDCAGVGICQSLLGERVAGVLMCSSWRRNSIVGTASGQLASDLEQLEFGPTPRIIGN